MTDAFASSSKELLVHASRFTRTVSCLALILALACGESPAPVDAGPGDAGPPDPPPSTDHCSYVELTPTAGAGGTVAAGVISAGAAERRITIPLGVTLGAYTSRSANFG